MAAPIFWTYIKIAKAWKDFHGEGEGTKKSIDIKSLIIGALLTSTIFLGVAAAPPKDTGKPFVVNSPESYQQWDDKQEWVWAAKESGPEIKRAGWQPFAVSDKNIYYRMRVK